MGTEMKKKISTAIAFSLTGICLLGFARNENSQNMEPVKSVYAESAMEARSMKMADGILPGADEVENAVEESILMEDSTEESSEEAEDIEKDLESVTAAEEQPIETPDSENEPEPFSLIGSLIVADVNDYVNIRQEPNTESEIVGKLYDDSVGNIIEISDDWFYIESGKARGYVKSEYVLTGEAAINKAEEVGIKMARVNTTTLKVRMEPSTDAKVLGLVPDGDLLQVLELTEDFAKVSVEEGEGYISLDYVELYTENVYAESKEEEEARLKKEREEREKAIAAANAAVNKKGNEGQAGTVSQTYTTDNSNAELGQQIVDYAVQFVGNPYVYGGTSLTNGADCSGFVQSVYADFGISLPRTSGSQGKSGSAVADIASAQPGDLVWYSGHIGIYMGNSQLVHASSSKPYPEGGIKISDVNYRTILGIRRII
jgi:cell wall-associated NlpC family hydrolase